MKWRGGGELTSSSGETVWCALQQRANSSPSVCRFVRASCSCAHVHSFPHPYMKYTLWQFVLSLRSLDRKCPHASTWAVCASRVCLVAGGAYVRTCDLTYVLWRCVCKPLCCLGTRELKGMAPSCCPTPTYTFACLIPHILPPTSHTLHLTPCTLHPTLYTLHP